MYISKYKLDLKNSEVLSAFDDVGLMHKYSWEFFKNVTDFLVSRENMGILFKVREENNSIFLTIQSLMKPNNVPDGATEVYSVDDSVMKKKLSSLETVGFQVYVNPTKQNVDTKKRHSLKKVQERLDWLKSYMSQNGCELLYATESDFYFASCNKGTSSFKVGVSDMCGRLKINDFDKFINMVEKGVGRSKSYGMGLLTFGQ